MDVAIETNPFVGDQIADALEAGDWPMDLLGLIARALPDSSVALARPAALVFQRLADASEGDSERRGGHLIDLSNWLSGLGRREEALAAIEEAVAIRRQLAEARPDAFLPDLATSLNNQSACLAELGRREEALAAIEEAVTIYRQLAAGPPRRVPARPRHVAEQPVRPPVRAGAAGGGPGRDRGSRHHPPRAGRRPARTRSCPTSPRR